jgi:uncharacterized protein
MAEQVFVDTAAWIALVNKHDILHLPARQVMDRLRQQKFSLVTTEFVLLEVADALSTPSLRPRTVDFVDSLLQFPQTPVLRVIPVSRDLWLKGWELYKLRMDKEWGLTDCTSFVVMRQEQITQAFTSDRHFAQAGFVNLL